MIPLYTAITSALTILSTGIAIFQKIRAEFAHLKAATQLDVAKVSSAVDNAHTRIDMAKEQIQAVDTSVATKMGQMDSVLSDAKQQIALVDTKVSAASDKS